MSDNWDFYFLQVDDRPASIYVDLGANAIAPKPELRHMACVRLHMNEPREDGMSSQGEFDALIAVEDALASALANAETDYVGRCTTGSCREFFFYIAQALTWQARVAACMHKFEEYRYQADSREDPDWDCYFNYLYPSPVQRQAIENRRVCAALEAKGDKLQEVREIDHWTYFTDSTSLNRYVGEAKRLGFEVRQISSADDASGTHCAQLWRLDVPAFNTIDAVTQPLFDLAGKYNGEYDGWESPVLCNHQE